MILNTICDGRQPDYKGKVRDIYDNGDCLVIVTTDRVSAYDMVMKQGVPNKGKILHNITKWWMEKFENTHFITDDLIAPWSDFPEMFQGRTMLVKKYQALPIECIVRNHICGSAWKEYQVNGKVCGIRLPPDLHLNQQFRRPIFTPSTKSDKHDENISCERMNEIVGNETGVQLMKRSLDLFDKVSSFLWDRGILIADTKLEFGLDENGQMFLIDECFTPDSSRFWKFSDYRLDAQIPSMDKQPLRDWLDGQGWDKKSPPPDLPDELTSHLSETYLNIHHLITGETL